MARIELSDGFDMGTFQEGELNGSTVSTKSATQVIYSWSNGQFVMSIVGQGLTYGGANGALLTGGVVQSLSMATSGGRLDLTGGSADAALLGAAYTQNDTRVSEAALLAGNDEIYVLDATRPTSTPNPDHSYVAFGYAGNDLMVGGGELSTFFGGTGDDTLEAGGAAATVLSGDEGDDSIAGGTGADTLIGGAGKDVLSGGAGADTFTFTAGSSGIGGARLDSIADWQSTDRLVLGRFAALPGGYVEGTASTYGEALDLANAQIRGGSVDFVAVGVGADVIVFADSAGDNGAADDAVVLSGRSLADISAANIVGGRPLSTPLEPTIPSAPSAPASPSAVINLAGTLDLARLGDLATASVTFASGSEIRLSSGGVSITISGAGFVYDADGDLTGGTVTGFRLVQTLFGATVMDFAATFSGKPVSVLAQWAAAAPDPSQVFQLMFGATPIFNGTAAAEVMHGGAGADVIFGDGGHDSLFGGLGSDVIYATAPWGSAATATAASGYLRGEDGDDYLVGGGAFDDLQGNMGNDTELGGLDRDWVVGGKDNDLLFGQQGDDVINGNLGADTCVGGVGADIVRGGQGDDLIFGDAGADWISGDLGDDTLVGGEGADTFHGFAGIGLDRILDFTAIEGDRVLLDPGTTYTVSQIGADTVIDLGGSNQMVLVDVQLSTLPSGWIVVG